MRLETFIHNLEKLAGTPALTNLKAMIASEGLRFIEQGFRSKQTPDGIPWKDVPKHPGHRGILYDTGNLRRGWNAQAYPWGVKFFNWVDYAGYHQFGTTKMVPRRMIPDSHRGLPQKWLDMISLSTKRAIRGVLAI